MKFRWVLLVLLALGLGVVAAGYRGATAEPVVRAARIGLDGWRGPPLRVALLSDLHVSGPDMPPERLARIVAQVNARRPDLVLIAGDLVSDKTVATRTYGAADAVAPLEALSARLGVVAVLGNHDHWRDDDAPSTPPGTGFARALDDIGVTLLANTAVKRGPLVIGGVDDVLARNHDLDATFAAMRRFSGPRVLLTHNPDIVPALPAPVELVLAGHTHCGQIAPRPLGIIVTASSYGKRFACGLIDDNGQKVLVTAGLGTSILPLRLGAPPDFWIVTLGPPTERERAAAGSAARQRE